MTPPIPSSSPGNCCLLLKRISRNTIICRTSAWWPSTAPSPTRRKSSSSISSIPRKKASGGPSGKIWTGLPPTWTGISGPSSGSNSAPGILPTWRTTRNCWNFSSTWTGPTWWPGMRRGISGSWGSTAPFPRIWTPNLRSWDAGWASSKRWTAPPTNGNGNLSTSFSWNSTGSLSPRSAGPQAPCSPGG